MSASPGRSVMFVISREESPEDAIADARRRAEEALLQADIEPKPALARAQFEVRPHRGLA